MAAALRSRLAGCALRIEALIRRTDVFLACVYAVYMYTVLRLRMTQEFNRIVPELPDLVRRLLGVYRPEV